MKGVRQIFYVLHPSGKACKAKGRYYFKCVYSERCVNRKADIQAERFVRRKADIL